MLLRLALKGQLESHPARGDDRIDDIKIRRSLGWLIKMETDWDFFYLLFHLCKGKLNA